MNERVRRLSEKLQGIQSNLESDRSSRYLDLEKQLDELESSYQEAHEHNSKRFQSLKDQVQKIEKSLDEELHMRDSFFEIKSQELLEHQARIQENYSKSLRLRKDTESKVLKMVDDKVEAVKSRMYEEIRGLRDKESESKAFIEQDIPKLCEFVQSCMTEREEVEAGLVKKLENQLADVEGELSIETKTREETEEAMLAMLRDVVSRIKSDLDNERRERESSEETLLSLLEETCAKLSSVTSY